MAGAERNGVVMEVMKTLRRFDAWVRSVNAQATDRDSGRRRDRQCYTCGCSRAELLVVPDVMAYSAWVCNEKWHKA